MGKRRSKQKPHKSKAAGGAKAKRAAQPAKSAQEAVQSSQQPQSSQQSVAPTSGTRPTPADGASPKPSRESRVSELSERREAADAELPAAMSPLVAPASWLAVVVAAGVLAIPGMSLSPTELVETGPFAPHHNLAALLAGALAAALGLWRPRLLPLSVAGVALVLFSLTGLEDRSLVSAFHRSAPRLFGLGPELWLALTWGTLWAQLDGKGRLGLPFVALAGFWWTLLGPSPVAGELIPPVLAVPFDTVDEAERFGRGLLPLLHLAMAVLGTLLCTSNRLRQRLGRAGLLGLFVAWAALSGAMGSEGWVRPLYDFPVLSHLLLRVTVLCAAVVTFAVSSSRMAALNRARNGKWILLACIGACYLLVESETWHWSKADENVYFYAARAMTDGIFPYADYFYAHPPMRVFLPGLLFAIFGFSVWTAKLIPAVSALVSAWCVSNVTERAVHTENARWLGLGAAALFLATERTLAPSSEFSGVNLATALAMLALVFAYQRRPLAAAVSIGLGMGVGMIIAWMVPVLALKFWLDRRIARRPSNDGDADASTFWARMARLHPALQFAVFSASCFGAVLGLGYVLGGEAFVTQVFEYHSLKAAIYPEHVPLGSNPLNWPIAALKDLGLLFTSDEIRKPISNNLTAWVGGAVGGVVLTWRIWLARYAGKKSERKAWGDELLAAWAPVLSGALLSLIFIGLLKEIYRYYWASVMPLFCVLAVITLAQLSGFLRRRPGSALAFGVIVVLLPARALATWGLQYPGGSELSHPGNVVTLPYRMTSPAPALSPFIASNFYKPVLVRGELEAPLHRVLWEKKKSLSVLDELVEAVKAETPEGSTITGSSTIAPLVALHAGRRLADNQVDTNSKVLTSGLRDNTEFWKALCDDGVSAIIAGAGMFSPAYMQRGLPVRGQFVLKKKFRDPMLKLRGVEVLELWVLAEGRTRCEL